LSDHHYLADEGTTGNGRGNDSRTTPATAKARDVIVEQSLLARFQTSQDSTEFFVRRDSVEPSEEKQSARPCVALPPEEREDQTQDNADNDAGDDWEIENRIAALDPNVARKFAEKAGADPAPENYSDQDNDSANNDEKFSEFGHALPSHEALGRARLCRADPHLLLRTAAATTSSRRIVCAARVANAERAMKFNGDGGAIS
jgi:hypothetical protein